jgi:hypothetical protein
VRSSDEMRWAKRGGGGREVTDGVFIGVGAVVSIIIITLVERDKCTRADLQV